MSINVEKRVPFGFKGEWGNVYKLYTSDAVSNNILQYQESYYYDIGVDVQFKYLNKGVDKYTNNSQPVQNLIAKGEYRTIETTDAMFDEFTNRYECVVSPNDIIKVFGCYWVCEEIEEHSVFTPAKQTFYYLKCKRIFNQSLEDLNVMSATSVKLRTINPGFTSSYMMFNEFAPIRIIWGDGTEEIIEAKQEVVEISHTYEKRLSNITEVILSRSEYEFYGTNAINNEVYEINLSKDVNNIESSKGAGATNFEHYPNLTTIEVDKRNAYYYSQHNTVVDKQTYALLIGAIDCKIPGVLSISNYAMVNRQQSSINIPDSVTSIGGLAFYGTNPSKITISQNSRLKTISMYAFAGNTNTIDRINIPKGVTNIEEGAFSDTVVNEMWFYTDIVPFTSASSMPDVNNVTSIYVKEALVNDFKAVLGDAYAEKIKGW